MLSLIVETEAALRLVPPGIKLLTSIPVVLIALLGAYQCHMILNYPASRTIYGVRSYRKGGN
jgi:hypothetical protein